MFADAKLYLQNKGMFKKWLSIFIPLSQHFIAAFSTYYNQVMLLKLIFLLFNLYNNHTSSLKGDITDAIYLNLFLAVYELVS